MIVLVISVSMGAAGTDAQQRGSTKRVVTKKPAVKKPSEPVFDVRTERITSLSDICIPPEGDYLSILRLDKNSNLSVTVQTSGESKVLFDGRPMASLNEVLSRIDKRSVVIVKADPTSDFGTVVKILQAARRVLDTCVKVEAETENHDPYVYILPEPREDSDIEVKPNPLILVVQLGKSSDLSLNGEIQGSLNDTSKLVNTLEQIFKAREENGVFREGSDLIEKTVFIRADATARFADVSKLVDAAKGAGAGPVGLLIDEPVPFTVETRLPLISTPPIKPRKKRP